MKMNKKVMMNGLVIVAIIMSVSVIGIIVVSDKSQETDMFLPLECEPVVVVTGIDYSSDPTSVPYQDIHEIFAENYSGSDLSIELRDAVIQSMMEKADKLGENSSILLEAIKVIYFDWEATPYMIPCYAEKAVFNNKSIWIIAFNRANGFEEALLGHFNLYLVSIPTLEAQSILVCNSIAIVHHFGCK